MHSFTFALQVEHLWFAVAWSPAHSGQLVRLRHVDSLWPNAWQLEHCVVAGIALYFSVLRAWPRIVILEPSFLASSSVLKAITTELFALSCQFLDSQ